MDNNNYPTDSEKNEDQVQDSTMNETYNMETKSLNQIETNGSNETDSSGNIPFFPVQNPPDMENKEDMNNNEQMIDNNSENLHQNMNLTLNPPNPQNMYAMYPQYPYSPQYPPQFYPYPPYHPSQLRQMYNHADRMGSPYVLPMHSPFQMPHPQAFHPNLDSSPYQTNNAHFSTMETDEESDFQDGLPNPEIPQEQQPDSSLPNLNAVKIENPVEEIPIKSETTNEIIKVSQIPEPSIPLNLAQNAIKDFVLPNLPVPIPSLTTSFLQPALLPPPQPIIKLEKGSSSPNSLAPKTTSTTTTDPAATTTSRKWMAVWYGPNYSPEVFDVRMHLKTRCERHSEFVPDKIYSSLKYDIMQTASGSLCKENKTVMSIIRALFSDTMKEVKNNQDTGILNGSIEVALSKPTANNKLKIKEDELFGCTKVQFNDVSYHYKKSFFCWEISYCLPHDLGNPIMKLRSPSFKVFARKPKEVKPQKDGSSSPSSSSKSKKRKITLPKPEKSKETNTKEKEKEKVNVKNEEDDEEDEEEEEETGKEIEQRPQKMIKTEKKPENTAKIGNPNLQLEEFNKLIDKLKESLEKMGKDEITTAKTIIDSKINPFFKKDLEEPPKPEQKTL